MMTPQKIYRLLILDRDFQVRLIICIILLGILPIEKKWISRQKMTIQNIKSQADLVARIPEMKTRLVQLSLARTTVPVPQGKKDIQLQGVVREGEKPLGVIPVNTGSNQISALNGGNAVLIDGEVYKVGDTIRGLTIIKIAPDGVTLQDKETLVTRVLTLDSIPTK